MVNLRITFTFNHGFEIVQLQSAMHCTICTFAIHCLVSANGSVIPSMVLRYLHDRRVGKGTNQHGNGFALSTYILLLLLRFTTYSHPTLGFATATPTQRRVLRRPGHTVRFGTAYTVVALRKPVRYRCVSYSASTPLSLLYSHVCLGPTQDTRGRIAESL